MNPSEYLTESNEKFHGRMPATPRSGRTLPAPLLAFNVFVGMIMW